ncbi:MAG: glycosyltransferase family 4 protein [Candidatus Bathyarchaeia archaeon]
MKVLQVIISDAFFGAERVVCNLAKGLDSNGVSCVILTTWSLAEKYLSKLKNRKNIKVYAVAFNPKKNNIVSIFLFRIKQAILFRKIVKIEKPDVIHLHLPNPSFILLLLLCRVPSVMTEHGDVRYVHLNLSGGSVVKRFVNFLTIHILQFLVDEIVAYQYSLLEKCKLLRRCCHKVIYNCIDQEWLTWLNSVNEFKLNNMAPRTLVFPGRLVREKGQLLLLKVADRLREAYPLRIVFVGDGPDRLNLEALAKNLNIQNAEFVGYVDDEEKFEVFKSSDVIIANLNHPELSQVLLEAAAIGKPTITFYDREVYQIFGESLWYIRQASVDEVYRKIKEIFSDYDYALKRASTAKKIALHRFNPSRFIFEYLKVYRCMLNDKS